MSALYRLKAYFGMVPAEDMDAYLDYDRDYGGDYGPGYRDDPGYYDDPPAPPEPRGERSGHAGGRTVERYAERRYPEPASPERSASPAAPLAHAPAPRTSSTPSAPAPRTRGALAVEPLAAEPIRPAVIVPDPPRAAVPAEPAAGPLPGAGEGPLSRITTVHPRSYNEARTIGERYRDGIPVIMNLTELDDAAAKRLVDFAAGLAFALRGSIDKVTNRVFLLSPNGVEVSAEDRRKLAERGFFSQD